MSALKLYESFIKTERLVGNCLASGSAPPSGSVTEPRRRVNLRDNLLGAVQTAVAA